MENKKKNKYERYFGKNIARIVYLVSCGLLLYGGFNIVVGNSYWGAIYCVIGLLPFFIFSQMQVSNKQIDEVVEASAESYLEKHIKEKVVNKRELNPADFVVFKGFIRDSGDVRFKSCRDGKMRTSKYYVTAINVTKQETAVSMTTYDLINETDCTIDPVVVKSNEKVSFTAKEIEFPKGNYECSLVYNQNAEQKEIKFYLPTGDYLVGQLIEKINEQ